MGLVQLQKCSMRRYERLEVGVPSSRWVVVWTWAGGLDVGAGGWFGWTSGEHHGKGTSWTFSDFFVYFKDINGWTPGFRLSINESIYLSHHDIFSSLFDLLELLDQHLFFSSALFLDILE